MAPPRPAGSGAQQVTWWQRYQPRTLTILLVALATFEFFRSMMMLRQVSHIFDDENEVTFGVPSSWTHNLLSSCDRDDAQGNQEKKIKIAYATSITGYTPESHEAGVLIDRAAVLHQSIKKAMAKSDRYDFDMFAFVHPDGIGCVEILEKLGYKVQLRDTPFNVSMISNEQLRIAQGNGCCKEKEYLKLYSYQLLDYPLVLHLDLDTIVLKPMDSVFDVMTATSPSYWQRRQFALASSMWFRNNATSETIPEHVDFMFTRDYNMVEPPNKKVHQMGVQGGFLLVRPSQDDFDKMRALILSGGDNFTIDDGWGGKAIQYGGYYGAGTIQGLASYFYGHIGNFSRSVELNRCYYNTMADNPHFYNKNLNQTLCTTLEPNLMCQDCRITPLEEVYTAHFTVCGKPDWCGIVRPDERPNARLCMELFREWHKTRLSLEMEWMERFPLYTPELVHVNSSESFDKRLWSYSHGHCRGAQYVSLKYPNSGNETLIE